jgi:hypothetical protein
VFHISFSRDSLQMMNLTKQIAQCEAVRVTKFLRRKQSKNSGNLRAQRRQRTRRVGA